MRARTVLAWFVIAPLLVAATTSPLPPPAEVKIGSRVGSLSFKDIHYLTRSLDDFPKAKVFVIAFTTTSCPVAQRYLPVLKALDKEFRDKAVQFLSINEGPDDSIVAVASQAVQHELEFPCVKDFDGSARWGGRRRSCGGDADSAFAIAEASTISTVQADARAHTPRFMEAVAVLAKKDVEVAETTGWLPHHQE